MAAGRADADEWLRYVRHWRAHDGTKGAPIVVYDKEGRPHDVERAADGTAPSMYELRLRFAPPTAPTAPTGATAATGPTGPTDPIVMPDVTEDAAAMVAIGPQLAPSGDEHVR